MTIKDIAKNLNVSYSTVSLSLNNDPRVAEKTKKRVIEEAERLGFTFNANARSLVTKKTNRIGIVFSDNFNAPDYRWFFNEIETYSTRAVENCGYDFLIQPNKNIHSQSNILRMVNGKMVDGLVIFSKTLTEAEYKFLTFHMYMCILNLPSPQIYRIISFGMTTGRGDTGLQSTFWSMATGKS